VSVGIFYPSANALCTHVPQYRLLEAHISQGAQKGFLGQKTIKKML